jgi:hypothetical protein
VTNDKSPVEHAVELFVYAPLGLALDARDLLPKLVERGRQQVTMARMIGQFAVQQGQTEATKRLGKAGEQANAVLTELGVIPRPSAEPPAPPPRPSAPTGVAPAAPSAAATTPVAPAAPARPGPTASTLAIADYDSLSASQVIPRLPGLSSDERRSVQDYESAHRGRKTILNRIAQLQSV